MILAEKITLLRKRNGWSQEELAEKIGVSRQAISKWESAQSTPDLNRVLALAKLFEVSTDTLLKDEVELDELPILPEGQEKGAVPDMPPFTDGRKAPEPEPLRPVSMEEAYGFLQLKAVSSGQIAIGVMLCILSPILLILLSAAQEAGLLPFTENQAGGIGFLVLMLLVGTAVGIFVYYGMKLSAYEYIGKEAIETAYGVDGMVRERKERYGAQHMRYMIIGILLCVLSCVPIFVALIVNESDLAMAISVCVLLAMVAVGVMLIVRTNIIMDAMNALLEEGEYSRENKRESGRSETVMGIYWALATAIYLTVSFLTGRWDITWIVWPIAGVCCGVLAAVLRMLHARE